MADCLIPNDWPELRFICWSRRCDVPIEEWEAWAIYRRNWRYVYQDQLTQEETALIERLKKKYGDW